MKKVYMFLIFAFTCFLGFGQTTVSYNFADGGAVDGLDETSPGITIDANTGFGSFKNSGTSNPAIYSGQLRLYQNATKGGSIKIYANNGATISEVIVNASSKTGPAAYSIDGVGSTPITISDGAYTLTGLSATSEVEFWCTGTSSSTRVYVDNFDVTYTTSGNPTAPAPAFTPAAGYYTTAQDITITAASDDKASYDIYYTTDGTTPTDASTLYTAPVNISTTTTLKAITYATGMDASSVTTGEYSFPIEVATIAELRTQATGSQVYVLTGQAVLTFQQSYRNQKFIQDATAAVLIDDNSGIITTTYNIGDGITGITGTLGEYGGMIQFTPTQDPGAASSTGNTFDPQEITLADFNANFEDYESELVKVLAVTFTDGGGTFTNGAAYEITDGSSSSKATSNFRATFYDVDYIGGTIPTTPQDIVCIANSRNDGDYLSARVSADIVAAPIPPVPVSSKGIIIAGLLIGLVVVLRKGRLF